jgi:hypothetical protein
VLSVLPAQHIQSLHALVKLVKLAKGLSTEWSARTVKLARPTLLTILTVKTAIRAK